MKNSTGFHEAKIRKFRIKISIKKKRRQKQHHRVVVKSFNVAFPAKTILTVSNRWDSSCIRTITGLQAFQEGRTQFRRNNCVRNTEDTATFFQSCRSSGLMIRFLTNCFKTNIQSSWGGFCDKTAFYPNSMHQPRTKYKIILTIQPQFNKSIKTLLNGDWDN